MKSFPRTPRSEKEQLGDEWKVLKLGGHGKNP
jgi:hypothetical protein